MSYRFGYPVSYHPYKMHSSIKKRSMKITPIFQNYTKEKKNYIWCLFNLTHSLQALDYGIFEPRQKVLNHLPLKPYFYI
jgi:hypothetical protein